SIPESINIPPPPPPPPLLGKSGRSALPNVSAIAPFRFSDREEQKRLHSNMLVLDGGHTAGDSAETRAARTALDAKDPNAAFASNVLKASTAEKASAHRMSNLGMTIAQGKIINAVMETAVNTDLPGTLRAIVSRDVYAESGHQVMIPKGSRLIGKYNTDVLRGQRRVMIIWTRLIRPDGIDIDIGSPGVDALGRSGANGMVDNKYSEIFSTALLTSVLDIGVAVATDRLSNNQAATSTTNANGTTSTGSAAAMAGATAVGNIGNVANNVINTMLDLRPTITLDQGTEVNVFVNKDLTFPNLAGGDSQFIE
ncbi:MAG: TrbI/VirB10 family protein, partial [Pseudomonadota bacterium]|nr:TrbI/VirB10 family protein [Pseudomonadota bacterium]